MAEVLVLAEHAEGKLKNVTAELITAARALGEPSAVVIGAPGTTEKLVDGLKAAGAAKIYSAESDVVEQYLVTPKVDVLNALVEQVSPVAVIVVASAEGKEIAGRVAAETGSGLLVDVIGVKEGPVGIHSIFGGAYTTEYKAEGDAPAISIRPGAVEAEPVEGAGELVTVEVPAPAENATKITSRQPAQKSARPELTEAKIVVAGGRGVGSKENFGIVEELADAFGGAVGASRAAVDSGFYEGQFQVGQTGKTVSPQLYVALGISGAIQHRAGMQTSKTIVAVNKDEEAPIFEISDYGIVGDLFKVTPQLTDAVKTRKG
ncbi:electron transfer flavoprotein subunit alpha/FixB family protein [Mycolicibacterium sp. 050158]|uniref:electron transfer flavoprotein subunit alpha/FixB family protein n=1 Tax=Mycolicibacterium sp. 050158 TaxID=3090602 RepID=UPI00299D4910|nr:electron transfer flavoprotein subunit alpha/FixB family protein [Mycolicibacterium sp. 050158]MDX1889083.1 electron transfer flavoprotein subunit alpha/FixB family protein [Mycolicibacterium sp. 050158]